MYISSHLFYIQGKELINGTKKNTIHDCNSNLVNVRSVQILKTKRLVISNCFFVFK